MATARAKKNAERPGNRGVCFGDDFVHADVSGSLRGRDESDPQHSSQSGVPRSGRHVHPWRGFFHLPDAARGAAAGAGIESCKSEPPLPGTQQSNTGNTGNGLVTVSQIMWIGDTTSASCVAVGAANCTNQSSFVFTQQIQFGNGTLANSSTVSVGECPIGRSEQLRDCAELRDGRTRGARRQRSDRDAKPVAGK